MGTPSKISSELRKGVKQDRRGIGRQKRRGKRKGPGQVLGEVLGTTAQKVLGKTLGAVPGKLAAARKNLERERGHVGKRRADCARRNVTDAGCKLGLTKAKCTSRIAASRTKTFR